MTTPQPITLGKRAGTVYLAYKRDAVDDKALADVLFRTIKTEYEHALAREAQALGYDVPDAGVRLQDKAIIKRLRDEANAQAKAINATYNDDLRRAVKQIVDDNPRAGRGVFETQVKEWDADRSAWKTDQIARTESLKANTEAKLDFHELNGFDTEYYFGGSLTCDICRAIAEKNPYTKEQAREIGVPHPNCRDVLMPQAVVKPDSRITIEDLWLGGA